MVTLSSVQIAEILDAHNNFRNEVGVPPLVWSTTEAANAQVAADQLALSGAAHSRPYGENVARGTAGAFTVTEFVAGSSRYPWGWGLEKANFVNGTFPHVSSGGEVYHYTQMIWRNTTEVGGGLATGSGEDILVCHYNPPGNVGGESVY